MRIPRGRRSRSRRGKILAMTVLMVPVLFGATLVSTDTAILVNAEAQLKTAADASALAGVMVLADETRLRGATDLSSLMITARSKAIAVSATNLVLGASPVLSQGDIVIGYLSPTDYTTASPTTTGSQALFNSMKITAQRSASHGGQIPTFFGGPLGIGGKDLSVTSTASVQNYAIKGFQNVNNQSLNLLPIVLDSTTYQDMISRTTADQYSFNTSTGAVSSGADGVPESQLYPVGTGNPGNFGTVKIGVSNNSTATLVSQIESGITSTQLATFPESKIQLDSSLSPPSITFEGNPGLSAGIQSALTAQIGKTSTIGVYDQSGGNGDNAIYRVVAFASVRIMAVNFQGNPKYVVVQPALVKDPTAIPDTDKLPKNLAEGGLVRVHLAR